MIGLTPHLPPEDFSEGSLWYYLTIGRGGVFQRKLRSDSYFARVRAGLLSPNLHRTGERLRSVLQCLASVPHLMRRPSNANAMAPLSFTHRQAV